MERNECWEEEKGIRCLVNNLEGINPPTSGCANTPSPSFSPSSPETSRLSRRRLDAYWAR